MVSYLPDSLGGNTASSKSFSPPYSEGITNTEQEGGISYMTLLFFNLKSKSALGECFLF